MCVCESEFSSKTICVNNVNESKFGFIVLVLFCMFLKRANRMERFRIEQIEQKF